VGEKGFLCRAPKKKCTVLHSYLGLHSRTTALVSSDTALMRRKHAEARSARGSKQIKSKIKPLKRQLSRTLGDGVGLGAL